MQKQKRWHSKTKPQEIFLRSLVSTMIPPMRRKTAGGDGKMMKRKNQRMSSHHIPLEGDTDPRMDLVCDPLGLIDRADLEHQVRKRSNLVIIISKIQMRSKN